MNVILITIDCLRADHLSCMGYEINTSPFMDSLAEKGMLFSQGIINGVGTFASFPALMTSTYPFMHGGYETMGNRKTIAKALQKRKYNTAGFNDNGYLAPYFGYSQGFEYYDWMGKTKEESRAKHTARKIHKVVSNNEAISKFAMRTYSLLNIIKSPDMEGKNINKRVFQWLEKNYTREFFMWMHYMDVHSPHYAPKNYLQKITDRPPSRAQLSRLHNKLSARDPAQTYIKGKISRKEIEILKTVYNAEIRYVDDCVKEIFNKLVSLRLDKNTVIIITGDHGEEFFEHGGYHWHGNFYDEMLHVPLIIYGPTIPRKKVERQVEQIDIAPTILDLFNQEEDAFTGKSLLGNNVGSSYVISEVAHDYVLHSRGDHIINIDFGLRKTSIRVEEDSEKWKYINCMKENKEELYNLNKDPFEKNNLIGEEEEKAKEYLVKLRKKLDRNIKLEEEQKKIIDRIRRIKGIL